MTKFCVVSRKTKKVERILFKLENFTYLDFKSLKEYIIYVGAKMFRHKLIEVNATLEEFEKFDGYQVWPGEVGNITQNRTICLLKWDY